MLLFLDVISPIPEFFIIADNKVIFQTKIITNESEKLSDHIFETYIKMNNDLNLTKKLEKIAITIGPGSYTSLRVGAAFVSGLKISQDLLFCPISINDILNFKSQNNKRQDIGFYICSSKNQNFFCNLNKEKKIQYIKLEDNKNYNFYNDINTIYYNLKEFNLEKTNTKQYKFSFINEILDNYEKLIFKKNFIIKPIYISNNIILN
tara:strand:+ start:925 stop:1542 length:618 start_codon:yes stop_codon:yes gene_type:complete